MILKRLNYLILLMLLASCDQKKTEQKQEIKDGIYHYIEYPGKKMIRNWGRTVWQLQIHNNEGTLSYIHGRGTKNFNLALILKIDENKILAVFDSILSSSYLSPSEIKELKRDEVIFEYKLVGDSLISNSDFFFITSSTNEVFVFNRTTDTIKIESLSYLQKNYIGFRNVSEYLVRGGKEKKKVILVPCYNGYDYAQQGYDFNPFLEQQLMKIDTLEFVPFPYKKMQGSGYQSVYDKKYCAEIIKNTDVDYLIMTRFIGNQLEVSINRKDKEVWGYETKILNVKTMEQKISIRATNLSNYEAIEKHIEKNIGKLVLDILEK